MKKKTYVEFRCLGTFFDDFIVKEVKNRNISELVFKKNCMSFMFFDIYSKTVDENSQKVELKSERCNIKKYEIGDLLTIDEVKKEYGESSSEYKTMQSKELSNAVRSVYNVLVHHNEDVEVIPQKDLVYEQELDNGIEIE